MKISSKILNFMLSCALVLSPAFTVSYAEGPIDTVQVLQARLENLKATEENAELIQETERALNARIAKISEEIKIYRRVLEKKDGSNHDILYLDSLEKELSAVQLENSDRTIIITGTGCYI